MALGGRKDSWERSELKTQTMHGGGIQTYTLHGAKHSQAEKFTQKYSPDEPLEQLARKNTKQTSEAIVTAQDA